MKNLSSHAYFQNFYDKKGACFKRKFYDKKNSCFKRNFDKKGGFSRETREMLALQTFTFIPKGGCLKKSSLV